MYYTCMYVLYLVAQLCTTCHYSYLFFTHFSHIMPDSHENQFWRRYGEIRRVGTNARHWTCDEYTRVLKVLQDDPYTPNSKAYKEQRYLKNKYQVSTKKVKRAVNCKVLASGTDCGQRTKHCWAKFRCGKLALHRQRQRPVCEIGWTSSPAGS